MGNKWAKTDPKCPRCGSHHLMVDRSGDGGEWMGQCKDCKKRWPYAQTHFQGEAMTCAMCGKAGPAAPVGNTNWWLIEMDGAKHYVCTAHFPPDGSPSIISKTHMWRLSLRWRLSRARVTRGNDARRLF